MTVKKDWPLLAWLVDGVTGLFSLARSLFAPIGRELLFLLGAWRPVAVADASAVNRFVAAVCLPMIGTKSSGPNILIEGHLAQYGPNYLFRTGLAAKAVQSVACGGDIDIVVNGFSYQWQTAIAAYRPFGIARWIFLGRSFIYLSPLIFLWANFQALCCFFKLRKPEELLGIRMGKIKAGDLVYDEILRSTKQPTIAKLGLDTYKVIARSWYYYCQYRLLFLFNSYRYYIATHTAYPEYGLLCRVALCHKVTVIETSDIQMSVYDGIGDDNLPTYHQGINSAILSGLHSCTRSTIERENLARESLRQRVDAQIKQMDTLRAYSGRVYQRKDLLDALGVAPQQRIGFILAHVFCDSPHLSSSMLHADYFRWLESTIECSADAEGITWIVKPHPSSALYGEEGLVESMVRRAGRDNLRVCPADMNTRSLIDCADVVVTVHGTAGLEYACFGIPVILAGTPFYAGFGFTHEPKTAEEYCALIRDAAKLDRLSPEQISQALIVFESWERQFDWHNPIVTAEVQAYVWGNGVPRDVTRAYALLADNLEKNDPCQLKLWKFARSVAMRESHTRV